MKKYIFSLALLTAVVAGCTKSNQDDKPEIVELSLSSVDIAPYKLKSVVPGSYFPDNVAASIGMFVTAADGITPYDGKTDGYSNVLYAKNAKDAAWFSAEPIVLSKTTGLAFGYYPYNNSVKDITSIPVKSSLNGDDYLYGASEGAVSAEVPWVNMEMKHALARLTVVFRKEAGYVGQGILQSMTLSSPVLAPEGILNAMDGSISAKNGAISFKEIYKPFNLEGRLDAECLIIPTLAEPAMQTVSFRFIFDGKEYTSDVSGIVIGQGMHATVLMTVNTDGVVLNGVSISDWDEAGGTTASGNMRPTDVYSTEGLDGKQGNL